MEVLELLDVCKEYPRVKALCDIDLAIKDSELLMIMGPSGSGKSTLLHMIGLLDIPTKGKIRIMGKPVSDLDDKRAALRSKFIGFVFQEFGLSPYLTAEENILLPAVFSGEIDKTSIDSIAESLGIHKRLKHLPSQLSGGEKQRVAIARALINDPKLIVADEPTGNLDSKTGEQVMNVLRGLADKGKAVVVVTHNSEHEVFADRIVKLRDGAITKLLKKKVKKQRNKK
ncbi:MAG: ABC transporter ATP-binding protein [Candidatus Altiarchaeota archaeon]|nr:ABC transporter ATP-binding protein [Candidatus Altiarchaeota archaeon]